MESEKIKFVDDRHFDRGHHKRMFSATVEENNRFINDVETADDFHVLRYYDLSNEIIDSIQTTAQLLSEIDIKQHPVSARDLINILRTQINEYQAYDNHFYNFLINDTRKKRNNGVN